MNTKDKTTGTILVASDNVEDAALVKRLLDEEFANVVTSTTPAQAVEDFAREQPNVLVLAFNTLAAADTYYQELYRDGAVVHQHSHRNIVLCTKDEVRQAYQRCRDGEFDDYVLFWPLTFDASRLAMTVHKALNELAVQHNETPTSADFAGPARRLRVLENLMAEFLMEQKQQHESPHTADAEAARGIEKSVLNKALNGLTDAVALVGTSEKTDDEMGASGPPARQPSQEWLETFRDSCEPNLEAVRRLGGMAERVRSLVLVVDDDAFQRKVTTKILEASGFDGLVVEDALDALKLLRKVQPDVILMDIDMPGMDGLEATRRIKQTPWLADIPVIMLTGHSDRTVVIESLKAGAMDYLVKPFEPDVLKERLTRAMESST